MELTSKVFALGNSNAVRFPQIVMEALSLHTDDPIVMEVISNDEIRIRKKIESEPYPSIKKLFAGYSGTYHPVEMESSEALGRELI